MQSDDPVRYSGLSDIGGCEKSIPLLVLRVPEVLQPFLLRALCSSQVCSNSCLNCCSSEADNEALTCYLREARFIRCAQTMPNTDSIKTTLTLLTPANIRTFKDQTPVPAQTYTFACCFPEVSQMATQCLSEMNHAYKCSVNSLHWQEQYVPLLSTYIVHCLCGES